MTTVFLIVGGGISFFIGLSIGLLFRNFAMERHQQELEKIKADSEVFRARQEESYQRIRSIKENTEKIFAVVSEGSSKQVIKEL